MAKTEAYTPITLEAAADLSANQFHFVVVDANGRAALVAAAGGDADGVLMTKPNAAGVEAQVAVAGVAKVVVGTGGITAGNKVQSDASGEAIAAATGDHVLGKALATGAAGEVVPVLLVSKHILA